MDNYSRLQKITQDEIKKALQAERETLTVQINSLTEKLNALESAFDNKNKGERQLPENEN